MIEDQGDFDPLLRQHRRHFHPYETASHHDCMLHIFGCVPDTFGIVKASQVKHILKFGTGNVQSSRAGTCGNNKLLKPEPITVLKN